MTPLALAILLAAAPGPSASGPVIRPLLPAANAALSIEQTKVEGRQMLGIIARQDLTDVVIHLQHAQLDLPMDREVRLPRLPRGEVQSLMLEMANFVRVTALAGGHEVEVTLLVRHEVPPPPPPRVSSKARVRRDAPRLAGPLDTAEVTRVLDSHLPHLTECFERAVRRLPDLSGRFLLRLHVSPAGKVTEAKVHKTTMRDEGLQRCILSKAREWSFPRARAASTLLCPYSFRAQL